MLTITALYGGILGLMYIYLASRIIGIRRKDKISIGDGGNETMARAIRGHGNFIEYVPITLLLMAICEINGAGSTVHLIGVLLLLGRFGHA